MSFTLCFVAVAVVAVTHLDRDNLNADYAGIKWNLNVLNIIEKSDKQEDLHLNRPGYWQTHTAYGSQLVSLFASEAGYI